MKIKKLDHIGIRVMNWETSIPFYEQFGFRVTRKEHKVTYEKADNQNNVINSDSNLTSLLNFTQYWVRRLNGRLYQSNYPTKW